MSCRVETVLWHHFKNVCGMGVCLLICKLKFDIWWTVGEHNCQIHVIMKLRSATGEETRKLTIRFMNSLITTQIIICHLHSLLIYRFHISIHPSEGVMSICPTFELDEMTCILLDSVLWSLQQPILLWAGSCWMLLSPQVCGSATSRNRRQHCLRWDQLWSMGLSEKCCDVDMRD